MSQIKLDPLAPNTAFILGAALAGGDPLAAARMLSHSDAPPPPEEDGSGFKSYDDPEPESDFECPECGDELDDDDSCQNPECPEFGP